MKNTVVKTYKGDRAAERGIELMRKRGYDVDQASARKVMWSPMTGLFTRKQKHTIVFHKRPKTTVDASGTVREHSATCVCADCCAARLAK